LAARQAAAAPAFCHSPFARRALLDCAQTLMLVCDARPASPVHLLVRAQGHNWTRSKQHATRASVLGQGLTASSAA
jgi:hypothetical protein